MRRIITAVPLAALLFGACADTPTAPFDEPLFNNGVASPGMVRVTVTIPGAGSGYWIADGLASRNGQGTCVTVAGVAGHYYNPANRSTSNKPHSQCWVEGTSNGTVITMDVFANHVKPRGGNEQLNFGTICDPADAMSCSDTWIHYKKNSNWSSGSGALFGTGYVIHLDTVDSAGNVFSSRPIDVTACPVGGGVCTVAKLNWTSL